MSQKWTYDSQLNQISVDLLTKVLRQRWWNLTEKLSNPSKKFVPMMSIYMRLLLVTSMVKKTYIIDGGLPMFAACRVALQS
jgi:hypothetical protein